MGITRDADNSQRAEVMLRQCGCRSKLQRRSRLAIVNEERVNLESLGLQELHARNRVYAAAQENSSNAANLTRFCLLCHRKVLTRPMVHPPLSAVSGWRRICHDHRCIIGHKPILGRRVRATRTKRSVSALERCSIAAADCVAGRATRDDASGLGPRVLRGIE